MENLAAVVVLTQESGGLKSEFSFFLDGLPSLAVDPHRLKIAGCETLGGKLTFQGLL